MMLIRIFKPLFILLLTICMSSYALAIAASNSHSAADALENQLQAIHSFSTQFSQIVRDENGRVIQRMTGELYLQRPNQFRWVIMSPDTQYVIADGTRLWVYDRDLAQVTVKPLMKTVRNTPALLLMGDTRTFKQDYRVKLSAQGNKKIFYLMPRQVDASFKLIQLVFQGDTLISMTLKDPISQTTQINFRRAHINPVLSPQLFQFKPPANVDVIERDR